ncbi:MAG: hypothetical protein JW740_02025 [Candidatus Zambryskibacteria bacterium]|nr:hypothetical protein [Candidatus Zambryskibacteria bacterium]
MLDHYELKEKNIKFIEEINRIHNEGHTKDLGFGHDIMHSEMTACYALVIGESEIDKLKGWYASMLHSLDRVLEDESKLSEILKELLSYTEFNLKDKPRENEEICKAVLDHELPNNNKDSVTKIILQDADRLANISPAIIIRAGQFRYNIPTFELDYLDFDKNPESTYHKPKSSLDDLRSLLEWEKDPKYCLRLPRAKELGTKYFEYIKEFINRLRTSLEEIGLKK